MNKNIYPGLALAVCMGVVSAPLFAEVSSTPEQLDDITAPETSAPEHLEPSELQRQQAEHKADVNAPATSTKEPREPLEPSELQRQQEEHNKEIAK